MLLDVVVGIVLVVLVLLLLWEWRVASCWMVCMEKIDTAASVLRV